MFIGHYAIGFAARRAAPGVSLGTLFLAAQFADLLWPTLVLAGIEVLAIAPGRTVMTPLDFVSYPWSHSAVTLLGWGLLLAAACRVFARVSRASALVVGALVASHWVLDWLTHAPDMPLSPAAGSARVGLGLWNRPWIEAPLEYAMLLGGLWLYTRATEPVDRTGSYALWGLAAFLLVVHTGNLVGPPPPGVAAVVWSAELLWLIVAWGYWIDRHRKTTA